jgi:N-acetylmuramoyl-L-alanine amidase
MDLRAILAAVFLALAFAGNAAGETLSTSEMRLRATGIKVAGDANRTRIVLQFDHAPSPNWFLLRGPHRLVVDIPNADFELGETGVKPKGLVASLRYGRLDDERSRLIIAAKGPFVVENLSVLANESSPGHRIVAELVSASEQDFETALGQQAVTTGSTRADPKGDRLGDAPVQGAKPFTIAIDPGHGGIDGGAEGLNGTAEKSVTLAFALQLKAELAKQGAYNIVMTREDDRFLRLDDRVRIARQHAADLLISIHADTIGIKGIHGATVYTVSDEASDDEAKALADRENLADQIAGVEISQENHEVADILIDLIRRETHAFSIRFARSLVGELSDAVEMIKNPHRSAGFKVLKAPDVPSVLVELGYLSNPRDEKRLLDPVWRGKAVESIASAIELFAASRSGAGG